MKKVIRNTTTVFLAGTGFAFVMFSASAPAGRVLASPLGLELQRPQRELKEAFIERISSRYSYVDPEGLVPSELLLRALAFYDANRGKIENTKYLSIVNTSSNQKTLFVVNMQDGYVGVQELNDSTQALSGYFSLDAEVDRTTEEVNLKIQSLSLSNPGYGKWVRLLGLNFSERQGLARLLSGGSLLFAGSSPEENLMQSVASLSFNDSVEAPPLWEARRKADGRAWTLFSFDVIRKYGSSLLAGSKDIGSFCPNYANLTQNQKMNFWTVLVSGVVKFESAFKPTSRARASSLSVDQVTGKSMYAEGLMQLSYQDSLSYPFCEFNWSADKNLSPRDPQKTIFDPAKNLSCGIRILNQIVQKTGRVASASGQYWSTLWPKSTALRSIRNLTNALPFCQL